jgi:hypothetical protein
MLIWTGNQVLLTDFAVTASLVDPFDADPLAERTLSAHGASEFHYNTDPFMTGNMDIYGMGTRDIVDIGGLVPQQG